MTEIAIRNRQIKKVLEQAFGRGKVRVKGSRGTAYGWVHVHIDYAPRNQRESSDLRPMALQLIRAAKIELSSHYSDDYTDNTPRASIIINFEPCREKADQWGSAAWRHHLSKEDWDALQADEAARAEAA